MNFQTLCWLQSVLDASNTLSTALARSLPKLSLCSRSLEDLIRSNSPALSDTVARQVISDLISETAACCNAFHRFFEHMDPQGFSAPPALKPHLEQLRESVDLERRRLGISAQIDADRVLLLRTVHPITRYSRTASGSPYDPEIQLALEQAHAEAYHAGLLANSCLPSPCTVFFWHVYSRSNHQSCISYPDNDNYLTKSIIDLICAVFGLQDIGTELSLFHSTALDDDLAPLTYVFVVPNDSDLASFLSFPSVKERLLRA